jgi:hypothetical protein
MRASEVLEGSALLIMVILILAAIGGWIANVVAIVVTVNDPVSGMFILRCVGVFVAPLGSVLGFF